MTANHEFVAQSPDAFLQEIQVLSASGEQEKAINYLLNNFFPRQEGMDDLHEIYVDACLGQGITELNAGNNEKALQFFKMADEYPENHQIGRSSRYEKNVQIYYYQALAQGNLNNKKEANQLYKAIEEMEVHSPDYKYYKALALKQAGKKEEAGKLAEEIEQSGKALLTEAADVDFFSKFGENQSPKVRKSNGDYLIGLADLLKGNKDFARQQFESAVELHPANLWGRLFLIQQ